jgi:hypothetical protein
MKLEKEQLAVLKKSVARLHAVSKNISDAHVALDLKYFQLKHPEFDVYMAAPGSWPDSKTEVSVKILNSVLAQIGPEAELSIENKVMIFKYGKTVLKIQGRSYDYQVNPPTPGQGFIFNNGLLSEIFSAGGMIKEDPFLSGSHITMTTDSLMVATTDGKQLVVIDHPYKFETVNAPEYIRTALISINTAKAISMLGKGLPGAMKLERDRVLFTLDTGTMIIARCKTNQFPDYKKYLEAPMKTKYQVESKAVAEALKRLGSVVDDEKVRTTLHFSGEELTISLPHEAGKDVVPMVPLSHDAAFDSVEEEFDFQYRFLVNTFSVLNDTVIIEANGNDKAVMFRDGLPAAQKYVRVLVQPLSRK